MSRHAPSRFRSSAPVTFTAEAPDSKDAPKGRSFEMVGYSGGPMKFWFGTVVMDMRGFDKPSGKFPALRQHDPNQIAGYVETTEAAGGGVRLKGRLSASTEAGREVAALSDEGFPWQASFGYQVASYDECDPEEALEINGQKISGVDLIARKWGVAEASFVPNGADPKTSARALEASADNHQITVNRRNKPMSEPTTAPKGATLADLKAAFPKDREFALDQFEAGATLAEAKAAYSDILQAKLDAAEAAAAKPAPAPAPKPSPRAAVPVNAATHATTQAPQAAPLALVAAGLPANAGPATTAYFEAVAAFSARGMSQDDARAEVSRKCGHLHDAYITEANGGLEWTRFPMQTARGEVRR